jgi:hypothetical protein
MWPFGSKPASAKLRMPIRQAGTMYGMFATVVVDKGNSKLNGVVKISGERHFTGRFGKFACVARSEPTDVGIDFVIGATAAAQPAPEFHRELAQVLSERVVAFNAMLKELQS